MCHLQYKFQVPTSPPMTTLQLQTMHKEFCIVPPDQHIRILLLQPTGGLRCIRRHRVLRATIRLHEVVSRNVHAKLSFSMDRRSLELNYVSARDAPSQRIECRLLYMHVLSTSSSLINAKLAVPDTTLGGKFSFHMRQPRRTMS